MNKFDFEKSKEKIKILLKQYDLYLKYSKEIENLKQTKEKNLKINIEISKIELKQKKLGEKMKFDNPYIWIIYKTEAYKNSPTDKIETIGDFIKHCNKNPDYICGKRFNFLNNFLKNNFSIDLLNENQEKEIYDFLDNGIIQEISKNNFFMKNWLSFEYFEENGETKKWGNYKKEEF